MSAPRRSLSNIPPMNMPPTSLQTIGSLPDKTFMQIFSYLDHKQILKCAEVAKRWRSLAYDPRLWQMVSLRSAYGGLQVINQEAFLALIGSRFGTSLKLIELQTDLITPVVIQELATKCSYLQHFTLDFSTAMQLHDFADLQSFPARLKSLTICLSENIFLEGFMRKIYTFINSLEILHLIGTYEKIQDEEEEVYETVAIQKLKSYTPNLRVVNFWGVLFITDEHVESLSSNTAHLECLSVCFCMKFVGSCLKTVLLRCRKLRSLLMDHCPLNNQAMKNIEWDKCQLQELNITATDLAADTLIFILTRLPFLRTLSAGYSENFNDQVMEAWMNSNACSNLTALDLDTCDSLSEPILTEFLNRYGFQMIGLGLGGHHKLVEHFWLTNLPILSQINVWKWNVQENVYLRIRLSTFILENDWNALIDNIRKGKNVWYLLSDHCAPHHILAHFMDFNNISSYSRILVMGIAEDCCSKVTAKVHIDQFIDCIAQNCQQLERLEIRWDQSTLRFSDKSTKFIDSLRLKCTKLRSLVLTDGQYFEMIKSNFERADRTSIVRSNTNYQTNMILLSPYYKALLFN